MCTKGQSRINHNFYCSSRQFLSETAFLTVVGGGKQYTGTVRFVVAPGVLPTIAFTPSMQITVKKAIAYFNENINSFDLVDTHMVLRTPPVL